MAPLSLCSVFGGSEPSRVHRPISHVRTRLSCVLDMVCVRSQHREGKARGNSFLLGMTGRACAEGSARPVPRVGMLGPRELVLTPAVRGRVGDPLSRQDWPARINGGFKSSWNHLKSVEMWPGLQRDTRDVISDRFSGSLRLTFLGEPRGAHLSPENVLFPNLLPSPVTA